MHKILSLMLGLSLMAGAVTVAFADDAPKKEDGKKKKKKKKADDDKK